MLVSAMRSAVHAAAKSSSYTAVQVDEAFMAAGGCFMEKARPLRARLDLAITSGSPWVNIVAASSAVSDFLPGQLISARVGFDPLEHVEFDRVRKLHEAGGAEGRPTMIGFETPEHGLLDRTPDAACTATLLYWRPLDLWTAGADDGRAINVPDRWMRGLILWGVVPLLRIAQSDTNSAARMSRVLAWRYFEDEFIPHVRSVVEGVGPRIVDFPDHDMME